MAMMTMRTMVWADDNISNRDLIELIPTAYTEHHISTGLLCAEIVLCPWCPVTRVRLGWNKIAVSAATLQG